MNKSNWDWQKKLLPEVKKVVAEHVIGEAPPEEDMRRNTDLIVLKMDTVRIAVRLRRHDQMHRITPEGVRYFDQFTIRSKLPRSGCETELAKVVSGWGDRNFYGFANADDTGLAAWVLGDLYVFRLWWSQQLVKNKGVMPGHENKNTDGLSLFRAFDISELPAAFVIARRKPDDAEDLGRSATVVAFPESDDHRFTTEDRDYWGLSANG
jgi:hypothetical protein